MKGGDFMKRNEREMALELAAAYVVIEDLSEKVKVLSEVTLQLAQRLDACDQFFSAYQGALRRIQGFTAEGDWQSAGEVASGLLDPVRRRLQ